LTVPIRITGYILFLLRSLLLLVAAVEELVKKLKLRRGQANKEENYTQRCPHAGYNGSQCVDDDNGGRNVKSER
jgi:hypothetical protein